MSLFCRHNRFEANCPICSREKAAAEPAAAPTRRVTRSSSSSSSSTTRRSTQRSSHVVTKRVKRAPDDGYQSSLVPGIRGSADARRLAGLLAAEDDFLTSLAIDPPSPWDLVAAAENLEEAVSNAISIVCEEDEALADSVRAWVERNGGAQSALVRDENWTPDRRFDRIYERLAIGGFGRPRRFRLLTALGALELIPYKVARMHFGSTGDDPGTLAAKWVLNSGDTHLLDRRAATLADAAGVSLAVLDLALQAFEAGGEAELEDDHPAAARIRGALGA